MPNSVSVVNSLKKFELDAINVLASRELSPSAMVALAKPVAPIHYEYTGYGYFLTIKDVRLPLEPRTLSEPPIIGMAEDVVCRFIVFLGDGKLTFECHTLGPGKVPPDFREQAVVVRQPLPDDPTQ